MEKDLIARKRIQDGLLNLPKVFWPGNTQVQRILRGETPTGLISLLGYPDQDIQRKSSDRLADIGEPAVSLLIESLKHRKMAVRIGAVEALGVIRARQAVNPLVDLLRKDKSNEVRWAAVYSLALIGDETAISMLVTALRDTDKYVRYRCIRDDIRTRIAKTIPQLKKLFQLLRNICPCFNANNGSSNQIPIKNLNQ